MNYLSPNLPLPLRNGALFIDNTFLEYLTTCARSAEYSQVRRRIANGDRDAASFGTAGHLCFDYRYGHFGTDLKDILDQSNCEQGQMDILTEYFEVHPPAEGSWRDLNWAYEIYVKKYNERYPIEPFNLINQMVKDEKTGELVPKPMVEMPFAIPFALFDSDRNTLMPLPLNFDIAKLDEWKREGYIVVFYCGKIDLPTLWDEHLFIVDHKSTSMLGDRVADEYRMSPQPIGYCYAWWKITGQMPIGFMINFIRTRPLPAKPQGGIAKWWEENYFRLKEYIQEDHYQEWEFNTYALIERFFWMLDRGYFPMEKKWCMGKYGHCQYYNICYTQPFSSRLTLLNDPIAFTDNIWSPLKERRKELEAPKPEPIVGDPYEQMT